MASRSQSRTATDHDEIRQWVEARGGRPAVVKSTRGRGNDSGILRSDFPGYSGIRSGEKISWEEFFEQFHQENFPPVYQNTTARGQKNRFHKIVSGESGTDAPRASVPAPPKSARADRPAAKPLTPRAAGDGRSRRWHRP